MTASTSAKTGKSAKNKKKAGVSPASDLTPSQGRPRVEGQTPDRRTLDRRSLLLCLGLMAAVFAAYSPITHNQFLGYDDSGYITDNAHVKAGVTWATVAWAFTTNAESNYHPVTWISHALDYQLFGLNPAGHHWMSVVMHAVNAVLLFLLLQFATGSRWRSLMVAALFALHPINVESVAWAAERKNVLSMMLFLLTLYAYVWYTRGPSRQRYATVAGLFALALLAKPQVITLPLLLLLLDYWPLARGSVPGSWFSVLSARSSAEETSARSFSFLLLEKVPLLLLSAVSAVVTMVAQKGAVHEGSHYSSVLLRLETAAISYMRYMGKAVWPTKLVAMYPHPTQLYPVWKVGLAVVILLLITTWVLRAREQGYLAVGWFWFLGSLVPMIGLVQVGDQEMADRYAYIPFIGLFVMVVWRVGDWAQARRISPRWLAAPAVACLLALAVLTHRQVGYWHDTESFWRRTLALTPDNFVAESGLAGFLRGEGKLEEAVQHYNAAVAIRPDDMPVILNLGVYEQQKGNLAGAIERYELVAQRAGNVSLRAKALANLGVAYQAMQQPDKAREAFAKSIELIPGQPSILLKLGAMAQIKGDLPEAVRRYTHALKLQPTDVGLLLLGNALLEQGGHDAEANAILERADRVSRNINEAQKQAQALIDGN
jgi:protein O-mannosyl-transferase